MGKRSKRSLAYFGDYTCPAGLKDVWSVGETAFFQYECWQDHRSADAELWYRSHQEVKIIDDGERWYDAAPDLDLLLKRSEAAQPRVYLVRFRDGFEGCATEGELKTNPSYFEAKWGPGITLATEAAPRAE